LLSHVPLPARARCQVKKRKNAISPPDFRPYSFGKRKTLS
jgi:hypothetical protein